MTLYHHTTFPCRSRRQFPAAALSHRGARAQGTRRDHGQRAALGRRPGDRRSRADAGGDRAFLGHRRGIPPDVLSHRFPAAAGRRADRRRDDDPQGGRHRRADASRDEGRRQGPPREGYPARGLRIPEEPDAPHAEGDDPVADDAALSRWPRGHQQGALPRSRGVLPGRRRRLWRRAPLARRRRMHVRADGRHQSRLPVRSEDARRREAARRRSGRAAASLRVVHQSRGCPEARRNDALHAPLPRQLQEHVGGAGRLRARRRSVALGNEGRRLFPGIRRRAQRRLPAVAVPAQGQDRRTGPRDDEGRHDGVEGHAQAPHRRGRSLRTPGAARVVAAVRLFQHRARQRHRDGSAGGEAPARRGGRERGLGRRRGVPH